MALESYARIGLELDGTVFVKFNHNYIISERFSTSLVTVDFGILSRLEKLRVEKSNGSVCYYQYGELHRDNGLPAISSGAHIRGNIHEEYFVNGVRHRDSTLGPAIIHRNGKMEFLENGMRHRDFDLPALIYPSGRKEYWVRGVKHRDGDMPAVIMALGKIEYWTGGLKTRDGDMPAVIFPSGSKIWFKDGVKHRDLNLGPAVIDHSGSVEYWLNGVLIDYSLTPAFKKDKMVREYSEMDIAIVSEEDTHSMFN